MQVVGHEAGHPKLVLWDSPEGSGGEGGGRGAQDGWTHVYTVDSPAFAEQQSSIMHAYTYVCIYMCNYIFKYNFT